MVIGATLEPSAFDLADLGGVILAPGFGVQGGTTETVRTLFAGCAPGTVLPSASRSLLSKGPDVATLRSVSRPRVRGTRHRTRLRRPPGWGRSAGRAYPSADASAAKALRSAPASRAFPLNASWSAYHQKYPPT